MAFHALNPDNAVECRGVARLFSSIYGDEALYAPLTDSRFWQEHAGRHLISLIARRDGQIVAHVALSRDPLFAVSEKNPVDPSRLSIKYAAIAPEATDDYEQLAATVGATIMHVAQRQQVAIVESFVLTPRSEQAAFGTSILGDQAINAILPGFAMVRAGELSLLISQRELRPDRSTMAIDDSTSPLRFSPHTRHPFIVYDQAPGDLATVLGREGYRSAQYLMVSRTQRQLSDVMKQALQAGFLPTGIVLNAEGSDRLLFSRRRPSLDLLFSDTARALASGAIAAATLPTVPPGTLIGGAGAR